MKSAVCFATGGAFFIAAVRLQDHVSVQLGYNFVAGNFPKNHNLQFGIGFTNFLLYM